MSTPRSSKRTGGPNTIGRKARSAFNAIKAGVYAMQVLLPGEDPEQFAELEAHLVDAFTPTDIVEAALVHDLTIVCGRNADWRPPSSGC